MRILVTGAAGMLGTEVCRQASERHEVFATTASTLDVGRHDVVFCEFDRLRPDVAIHLAAWTDVDGCERDPDRAYRVNTLGTQNVALACQRRDIPLIFLSSIAVFDGDSLEPYTEFDTPNPRSVYGRSKYQAELTIQSLLRRYYIVRAGWMFGSGERDKKFVGKILQRARESSELRVVDDKFGSPTYTVDLARALERLVESGLYGVFHIVNSGGAPSRFDLANFILECAGITSCRAIPVSSADFTLPAPRPRMEAARMLRLELLGLNWMRPWPDALREYLSHLEP